MKIHLNKLKRRIVDIFQAYTAMYNMYFNITLITGSK